METVPDSVIEAGYRHWLGALASLATCQWQLLALQWQVGRNLTDVVLGLPVVAPEECPSTGDDLAALQKRALERVRQGMAPPREIYAAPYRDRIEWVQFPDWARPSDPDLFELGHEG